jgi:hypothetical protein
MNTDPQFAAAVDALIADMMPVVVEVLDGPYPRTKSIKRLRALVADSNPDATEVFAILKRVVPWVIYRYEVEIYPLSLKQQRLLASASRLSDAIHNRRHDWGEPVWE